MIINESTDETPLSPQFAALIFFTLFSLLFFLFIKFALLSKDNVPFILGISGSGLLGALFGYLNAPLLAKQQSLSRLIITGIAMAIVAILLISLVVLLHGYYKGGALLHSLHSWQDYCIIYGVIVASLGLIIGVWLIPVTVVAVVYFNKRFFPELVQLDKRRLQERHTLPPTS